MTTFKTKLTSDTKVAALLATAREAQATYKKEVEALWPTMHPEDEVKALKAAIGAETNPDVIRKATNRIAQLQDTQAQQPGIERARQLACQALSRFSVPLQALLKEAGTVADRLVAEAAAAEKDFFASWSVTATGGTAVSAAAKALRNSIADQSRRLFVETSGTPLGLRPRPGSLSEIVSFFV